MQLCFFFSNSSENKILCFVYAPKFGKRLEGKKRNYFALGLLCISKIGSKVLLFHSELLFYGFFFLCKQTRMPLLIMAE